MGGFLASNSPEGGILIERSDFIACRVPEWRVSFSEPIDINNGPSIPKDPTWRFK